jgi:hypothetical protein
MLQPTPKNDLDVHLEGLCKDLRPSAVARRLVAFCKLTPDLPHLTLGHPETTARIDVVGRFVEKSGLATKTHFIKAAAGALNRELPLCIEDRSQAKDLAQIVQALDPYDLELRHILRARLAAILGTTQSFQHISTIQTMAALVAPLSTSFKPIIAPELSSSFNLGELLVGLYQRPATSHQAAFSQLLTLRILGLDHEKRQQEFSQDDELIAALHRWDPQSPREYLGIFAFEAALTEQSIFSSNSPALRLLNQRLLATLTEWKLCRESTPDIVTLKQRALALIPHVSHLSAILQAVPEYNSSLNTIKEEYRDDIETLGIYALYAGADSSDVRQLCHAFGIAPKETNTEKAEQCLAGGIKAILHSGSPSRIVAQLGSYLEAAAAILSPKESPEGDATNLDSSLIMKVRNEFLHDTSKAFRVAYSNFLAWYEAPNALSEHDDQKGVDALEAFCKSHTAYCYTLAAFTGHNVAILEPEDFLEVAPYSKLQIEIETEIENNEPAQHEALKDDVSIDTLLLSDTTAPEPLPHTYLGRFKQHMKIAEIKHTDASSNLLSHFDKRAEQLEELCTVSDDSEIPNRGQRLRVFASALLPLSGATELRTAYSVLNAPQVSRNQKQVRWAQQMTAMLALSNTNLPALIPDCPLSDYVGALRELTDAARDRESPEYIIHEF